MNQKDDDMSIDLPDDLEQFVRDQVRAGHYPTEGDVIRDAVLKLKLKQTQRTGAADSRSDPVFGAMRGDAEVLDRIVEEAFRAREDPSWRRGLDE